MPLIPFDDMRNLPLPDLALSLLRSFRDDQINFNNLIQGVKNGGAYGEDRPSDLAELLARLSDAWAWLEAHGLIGPSSANPQSSRWQRLTTDGERARDDPAAVAKVWSDERLAGDLDTALSSARANFALGDYETAAFAAMKAVEVSVREAAGLPNELLGVKLMRTAFSPKDGALSDPKAESGEQQATADLFAGAIGAYKNPASHRTVRFEDPVEAAEIVQLADLLLRIVRRARDRPL